MSFFIAILALLRCGYGPEHKIHDSPGPGPSARGYTLPPPAQAAASFVGAADYAGPPGSTRSFASPVSSTPKRKRDIVYEVTACVDSYVLPNAPRVGLW